MIKSTQVELGQIQFIGSHRELVPTKCKSVTDNHRKLNTKGWANDGTRDRTLYRRRLRAK